MMNDDQVPLSSSGSDARNAFEVTNGEGNRYAPLKWNVLTTCQINSSASRNKTPSLPDNRHQLLLRGRAAGADLTAVLFDSGFDRGCAAASFVAKLGCGSIVFAFISNSFRVAADHRFGFDALQGVLPETLGDLLLERLKFRRTGQGAPQTRARERHAQFLNDSAR